MNAGNLRERHALSAVAHVIDELRIGELIGLGVALPCSGNGGDRAGEKLEGADDNPEVRRRGWSGWRCVEPGYSHRDLPHSDGLGADEQEQIEIDRIPAVAADGVAQ